MINDFRHTSIGGAFPNASAASPTSKKALIPPPPHSLLQERLLISPIKVQKLHAYVP